MFQSLQIEKTPSLPTEAIICGFSVPRPVWSYHHSPYDKEKPDLLSASFRKPRMDSISATEYGEVETFEVKESTRIQHARTN